jgi:predicted dienelactone hydrolase
MLLLLALACGKAEDTAAEVDPLSWSVEEAGPYRVGYRAWEVTYTPLGEDRTILINAWYPTEDTEGDEVSYLGVYPDEEALGGASLAPGAYGGRYPVHVHSHGSQAWGGSSAFLMRHLASHGWIVVAPDHTGNTLLDNLDPRPTSHYIHRPQDITVALDALADDPDLSAGDTSQVSMSGHSFGCYPAWISAGAAVDADALAAWCEEYSEGCTQEEIDAFLSGDLDEPRVVASVPMAGGYRDEYFGEGGYLAAHAGMLMMTGSEDSDDVDRWYPTMDGLDRTWIELAGGCHETFALGVCDSLDPDLGYAIVKTYGLAFARQRVLGDTGEAVTAILDGSTGVSDVVSFSRDTR